MQFTFAPAAEYSLTPHATHDVAPVPDTPVPDPAPHATHTPAAPLAFTYEPSAHATHSDRPTRPSVVLPLPHAVQLATAEAPAAAYVFTPHATHDVAPEPV